MASIIESAQPASSLRLRDIDTAKARRLCIAGPLGQTQMFHNGHGARLYKTFQRRAWPNRG